MGAASLHGCQFQNEKSQFGACRLLDKTTSGKQFSHFSTKIYVVGTQKNHLKETVLLGTQNISFKLWVRKYLQFYAENFCLS